MSTLPLNVYIANIGMATRTAIENCRLAGNTGEQATVWHAGLHKGSRSSASLVEKQENILRLNDDDIVVVLCNSGQLAVQAVDGSGWLAILIEDYVTDLPETTSGPEETRTLLQDLHTRILKL